MNYGKEQVAGSPKELKGIRTLVMNFVASGKPSIPPADCLVEALILARSLQSPRTKDGLTTGRRANIKETKGHQ